MRVPQQQSRYGPSVSLGGAGRRGLPRMTANAPGFLSPQSLVSFGWTITVDTTARAECVTHAFRIVGVWSAIWKVRLRNALNRTDSRAVESHVTWNPTSHTQCGI